MKSFFNDPLHCLCATSNKRTRGQFECDVIFERDVKFEFGTVRLLFHSMSERMCVCVCVCVRGGVCVYVCVCEGGDVG